jgi:hypothetical protein
LTHACACGGVIAALDETDQEIVRAVQEHQKRARHIIWRANGGFDQAPRKNEAYEGRLDRMATDGQRPTLSKDAATMWAAIEKKWRDDGGRDTVVDVNVNTLLNDFLQDDPETNARRMIAAVRELYSANVVETDGIPEPFTRWNQRLLSGFASYGSGEGGVWKFWLGPWVFSNAHES